MNSHICRRSFLAGTVGLAAPLLNTFAFGAAPRSSAAQSIRINIDLRRTLGIILSDFLGLGYEISSVARPGLLSAQNQAYVRFVRTLGANGVIRVGGNTSDDAVFAPDRKPVSAPKSTVIDEGSLKELGTFLTATGWKLIWGLNLGTGTERQAADEAQAIAAIAGDNLLALEIGNEPDLFGRGAGHRAKAYSYENYLEEYRRVKAAIRAKLPNAPFAGPDAATATDWVSRFANDEGSDLKLLTHHYYRECAKPTSTLATLLDPDPKLPSELEKLRTASTTSHVPYRICETNSFCGGGKPGVSDTFGAALWALDYMLTLASADAAGVNMETGVNQLGFISSYSPIGDDERGTYSTEPEYYGMLAFSHVVRGRRVALDFDSLGVNLSAYAVLGDQKRLSVVIINKDTSRDGDVTIAIRKTLTHGSALRLTAPSLESKDGVKLGGTAVAPDGSWKPALLEPLPTKGDKCDIGVPAASAVIVNLEG